MAAGSDIFGMFLRKDEDGKHRRESDITLKQQQRILTGALDDKNESSLEVLEKTWQMRQCINTKSVRGRNFVKFLSSLMSFHEPTQKYNKNVGRHGCVLT